MLEIVRGWVEERALHHGTGGIDHAVADLGAACSCSSTRWRRVSRSPDIRLPHKAIERLRNGETQAGIARTYGLDGTTIGRLDCATA